MNADYIYGDDILSTPDGCRDEYKEYVFTTQYTPVGSGGVPLRGLPMTTDSDADFIARAVRGSSITFANPGSLVGGGDVAVRWTNVNGRWLQNTPIRLQCLTGTSTNPRRLAPAMLIPAGGVILFDVVPIDVNYNNVSQLFVVFIGVKRYRVI